MPYGDAETLLRDWADTVTDTNVTVIVEGDEGLPTNLVDLVPLVAVSRFGGGDNTITLDAGNFDVDTYAATHADAKRIAEALRTAIRLNLPGHTTPGLTVARTRTITAPTGRDWQHTNVFLVGASYQITTHARLAA